MEVFICKKKFHDESLSNLNENLAVFSSLEKAQEFKIKFPGCSIDDPETFDIIIEKMIVDDNKWI